VAQPSARSPAQVLLIQRGNEPFKGSWCLPGGFVDEFEPLNDAAARELQEETSVDPSNVPLLQVGAYGDPGRDPRGWTVTVAYAALVPSTDELNVKVRTERGCGLPARASLNHLSLQAADDAANAQWFDIGAVPQMAFDHKLIVRECLERIVKLPEAAGMREQLDAAITSLAGDWRQQG